MDWGARHLGTYATLLEPAGITVWRDVAVGSKAVLVMSFEGALSHAIHPVGEQAWLVRDSRGWVQRKGT